MNDFDTIRQTLSRHETAELRRIWIEHDEVEWRPEAFTAIASILQDRGEPLPEQGGQIGALFRAQRIQERDEQKRSEINRTRARAASVIAFWLGAVVAVLVMVGLALGANAVIPESLWPDVRGNWILEALATAVALGIYGFIWRLSAVLIWRIVAGNRNYGRS
jgi:hypothetical protein